jgi:molybdopterin molybdotransferase
MISVEKALKILDRETWSLKTERVDLGSSVGRVLGEEIRADMDLPPFDRSQMDGYAVISADTVNAPVVLNIVGESAAGNGWSGGVGSGEAVRIMTGARVPAGADSVQKVERTRELNDKVEILEPVKPGTAIVPQGAEVKRGTIVYEAGIRITENIIAVLASFGYARVKVGKRPRVAILGTGSEIVEITKKPGRDQIRNSNSVMLAVNCSKFGAEARILPSVNDNVVQLKKAFRDAAKASEIIIITGGVSVGKYDHTKTVLTELGAEIFFDKLSLKPGKPMVFGRLGKTLVFGLPGNPVSAAVTFHIFVRAAILKMQGATTTALERNNALMAFDAKANRERVTYLPSRVSTDKTGQLLAQPVKWGGSSDFIAYASADSLTIIPKGESKKKGELVEVVYL